MFIYHSNEKAEMKNVYEMRRKQIFVMFDRNGKNIHTKVRIDKHYILLFSMILGSYDFKTIICSTMLTLLE